MTTTKDEEFFYLTEDYLHLYHLCDFMKSNGYYNYYYEKSNSIVKTRYDSFSVRIGKDLFIEILYDNEYILTLFSIQINFAPVPIIKGGNIIRVVDNEVMKICETFLNISPKKIEMSKEELTKRHDLYMLRSKL